MITDYTWEYLDKIKKIATIDIIRLLGLEFRKENFFQEQFIDETYRLIYFLKVGWR